MTTVERTRRPLRLPRMPRTRRYVRGLDQVGVLFALAAFFASLTPSLLPRTWAVQGLVTGLASSVAYGIGVAITWTVRRAGVRRPGPRLRRITWTVVGAACVVLVPLALVLSARWDGELRRRLDMPPSRGHLFVLLFLVAALVFVAVVGVARLVHRLYAAVEARLAPRIPAPAARLIASGLVAGLVVSLASGVLYRSSLAAADAAFAARDRSGPAGLAAPASGLRSGGPGSLVPWSGLGRKGRVFVTSGPTPAEISGLTGRPAKEPIRVYAGLDSAGSLQDEADLVVRELRRTGAFSRAVLAVATSTGTGWIDASVADPLEYVFDGDTAIASLQYSYLPSWISFLVDQERVRRAGRILFNTVYDAWSQLPADSRPKLAVFGESLGALGAGAAFSGTADLTNRTDAALFVGTPNRTDLWRDLTDSRAPGSPERLPVIGDGRSIVFTDRGSALRGTSPDAVFLQHASDPVVWWSTGLVWSEPDWLRESPGPDVLPQMRWFPVVTFWQVTCDLAVSMDPPPGHGHRYGTDVIEAWIAMLHPPHWTAADGAALSSRIARYSKW